MRPAPRWPRRRRSSTATPGPATVTPTSSGSTRSGPTDVAEKVDFSEGDAIELFGYKGGTFFGQKGGNELAVTINGVVIDSLDDLRELDAASAKVSIRDGGHDTLVMDIEQPAGVHSIQMTELAHLYFA